MFEQTKDPIRNKSSCKRRNNNTELISITCLSMRHESTSNSIVVVVVFDFTFSHLHLPHCQCQALPLLAGNFPFFIAYAVRSRSAIHSVSSSKMHFASLAAVVVVVSHPQTILFMPFLFYFQPSTHSTLAPSLPLSAPWCIARFLPSSKPFFTFFLHTQEYVCNK